MKTPRDLIELETAHAVRRLGICERCDRLGDKRTMLFGKEHQSCFVDRHAARVVESVLLLPREESKKLMLDIIGSDAMSALLKRSKR